MKSIVALSVGRNGLDGRLWKGPFGYCGEHGYQEDATGLQLLGHRYYDPSTGRFLTRDPAKDGRNWYGYCGNSPVTQADPSGLMLASGMLGGHGVRVSLAARSVVGKRDHTMLIIRDLETGDTWVSEGGPTGFCLSRLRGYVKRRPIDEDLTLDQEIYRTTEPPNTIVARFRQYAATTSEEGYEAYPQGGGNSNSWTHEHLYREGYGLVQPEYQDRERWAPGWYDNPWRHIHLEDPS